MASLINRLYGTYRYSKAAKTSVGKLRHTWSSKLPAAGQVPEEQIGLQTYQLPTQSKLHIFWKRQINFKLYRKWKVRKKERFQRSTLRSDVGCSRAFWLVGTYSIWPLQGWSVNALYFFLCSSHWSLTEVIIKSERVAIGVSFNAPKACSSIMFNCSVNVELRLITLRHPCGFCWLFYCIELIRIREDRV